MTHIPVLREWRQEEQVDHKDQELKASLRYSEWESSSGYMIHALQNKTKTLHCPWRGTSFSSFLSSLGGSHV